jgi:hypothetical protein
VGLHRQIESIFSERKPQFPEQFPNQMFATHAVGAMAEFSVAKELGLEWEGHINHFSRPDLVARKGAKSIWIEVRYSPKRNDIKVKDSDPDRAIVVGVTGLPPDFEILGFARAGTVKKDTEQSSPAPGKPAWFTKSYRPISELKDWLKS